MFGCAILGVAYWLAVDAFGGPGISRWIKYLIILNEIGSVLGVIIPVIDPTILLDSEANRILYMEPVDHSHYDSFHRQLEKMRSHLPELGRNLYLKRTLCH